MAEILFVALVALMAGGFLVWAAWTRLRVHAPAEQVESDDLDLDIAALRAEVDRAFVAAGLAGRERPYETAVAMFRATGMSLRGIATALARTVAYPPGSRGVDRVPERLRVTRTKPLPPPLPHPVEHREIQVHGRPRWVRAPYRNPDRVERLAKSGRLRAELRT